jgi:hypothetical protein
MEAEDLFLLGRGLLRRGQPGPALASLNAARDIQPDHAETLDALAQYWADTRSMTEAVEAAERLMRQPGWELRGAVRLARLRWELLDPVGAARLLAGTFSRDRNTGQMETAPQEIEKLLVRCLLQSGQPAEARARIQDWSGRELDAEASWLLSRALLQEGQAAAAGAALEKARGFGTRDPMLHEPAPFVGAASCAPCHPEEFDSQQKSRHAQTLQRAADLKGLLWPHGKVVDADHPGVEHQIRRLGDQVEIQTQVDQRAFRAIIEFALGSNHQGQSFLARDQEGQIRELRLSHYPGAPEWDRTMEHPSVPPDLAGYLGRPIGAESFRKCLHCHATNFRAAREPDGRPEASDRGIGCERCHGPGGHHRAAIAAHLLEPAIARPRLALASQVVALCGDCHTAPPATTPASAQFVRYQASSFVLSRCYTASSEGFSCVTCHDPHQDAETSAISYEARCLACHPTSRPRAPDSRTGTNRTWATCPVNPRNDCLTCHMPRVKDAVPRTEFTDHRIQIHRH